MIHAVRGTADHPNCVLDSHSLEALKEVASCDYEYHSYWGAKACFHIIILNTFFLINPVVVALYYHVQSLIDT